MTRHPRPLQLYAPPLELRRRYLAALARVSRRVRRRGRRIR